MTDIPLEVGDKVRWKPVNRKNQRTGIVTYIFDFRSCWPPPVQIMIRIKPLSRHFTHDVPLQELEKWEDGQFHKIIMQGYPE